MDLRSRPPRDLPLAPAFPRRTRRFGRRRFIASAAAFAGALIVGCGDDDSPEATPSPSPSSEMPSPEATPAATATPPSPTPTPSPTATPVPAYENPAAPTGFPLDPGTRLGIVRGEPGSRTLVFGEGPTALEYSRDDQPSDDPARANRCGWNARVHLEYEGQPAVDWYIPGGTPVHATMDGTATTLLVNTTSNPFDVYGVSREPYIGNPDRQRAPISPFPGVGGGQGCFVRIDNDSYRTDYAHLDLALTAPLVPSGAFLAGYAPGPELVRQFAALRDFRVATAIAQWSVRKGDVIGFSGDSGYSEAPHLHYTIRYAGTDNLLCPTAESVFPDNGWLLKTP